MKHVNITVQGKVQAVGFRFSAMEMAYRYGIHGFVKNFGSDSVFMEAEGLPEMLETFIAWCHRGPIGSRVDKVLVEEAPVRNYSSFDIVQRNYVPD